MSDTTAELALKLAVDADDTADYLTVALRSSLNTVDGLFSSSTGHNHNGSHQGGNLVFGTLNTTSIAFANGATLGPFSTGNQLRFQSTNVSFSGAITVDGASTHTGVATFASTTTMAGLLTANGGVTTSTATITTLNVNGAATITGVLTVGGVNVTGGLTATVSLRAPDVFATTGWFRNDTAATGLYNTAVARGLRFDSGREGPIMHGGSYDGARVHGTPHVRGGYFQTPSLANGAEAQVQVNYSPSFPAGASPTVVLTQLRGPADNMQWRIGLELGQVGPVAFNARVRNETGSTQATYVAYFAYWNE